MCTNFSSPDFFKFSARVASDAFRNWHESTNFSPRYEKVRNCSKFVAIQFTLSSWLELENAQEWDDYQSLWGCGKIWGFRTLPACFSWDESPVCTSSGGYILCKRGLWIGHPNVGDAYFKHSSRRPGLRRTRCHSWNKSWHSYSHESARGSVLPWAQLP